MRNNYKRKGIWFEFYFSLTRFTLQQKHRKLIVNPAFGRREDGIVEGKIKKSFSLMLMDKKSCHSPHTTSRPTLIHNIYMRGISRRRQKNKSESVLSVISQNTNFAATKYHVNVCCSILVHIWCVQLLYIFFAFCVTIPSVAPCRVAKAKQESQKYTFFMTTLPAFFFPPSADITVFLAFPLPSHM